MTTPAAILADVDQAHAAGLCVLPPRVDGSKHPVVNWTKYQQQRPTLDQLARWYRDEHCTGIGLVCGPVSGDLEMFEAEDLHTLDRFRREMAAAGQHALLDRLDHGYLEQSPGGGVHWLYRCTPSARNHRVACRPKRPQEMKHPKDKRQILLETRGAGGYTVVARSYGSVHPTGRPYLRLAGGFDTIPTLTVDERDRLWEIGARLDEMPPVELKQAPRRQRPANAVDRFFDNDDSPMVRFNREAQWPDILEPHGWTYWHTSPDGNEHWARPGKQRCTSATIDGHRIYVFSSSTDFEPEQAFSKFAAYSILNHGGDMTAAARALTAWWRRSA